MRSEATRVGPTLPTETALVGGVTELMVVPVVGGGMPKTGEVESTGDAVRVLLALLLLLLLLMGGKQLSRLGEEAVERTFISLLGGCARLGA